MLKRRRRKKKHNKKQNKYGQYVIQTCSFKDSEKTGKQKWSFFLFCAKRITNFDYFPFFRKKKKSCKIIAKYLCMNDRQKSVYNLCD